MSSVSPSPFQGDVADPGARVPTPREAITTDWIDDFQKEQDPSIYLTNRTAVNSVDFSESETAREEVGGYYWDDMTDGARMARNFSSEIPGEYY